jgi:apolipoprotein N-acyltransferase
MKFPRLMPYVPSWKNAALAALSSILLILSFPDFEFWFLAWFALIPLFMAIEREKESSVRSFVLGWLWGFLFFTGTCWWLTFAPINYAGFPPVVAYLLLFCVTGIVGIFPGIFAVIFSALLRRVGKLIALLVAPSVWVFTEFLRYWLTGNNWNAIGYSQAFADLLLFLGSFGGVAAVSFFTVSFSSSVLVAMELLRITGEPRRKYLLILILFGLPALLFYVAELIPVERPFPEFSPGSSMVIAVQPNVPMSGLTYEKWKQLRAKHVQLAESALATNNELRTANTTVIFPESPMNFAYEEDEEFRHFLHAFAARNNVNVLFNSAEPDAPNNKYFNSAVLVGTDGKEIAQYDKIYLLPFGESVPAPLQAIVPAFVGSFSYGKEYDLLPIGDAQAGVMICFESHFGELGREYVRDGADVLIEMTNDGYLGPTPVLRQHLANAVFRAVETNRPVLRVTNVGITAYVSGRGDVMNPTHGYTEDTRVWSVAKSDGGQTFYVKYGDWFAWLCSIVTLALLALTFKRRSQ